jgi:hypothetical protein
MLFAGMRFWIEWALAIHRAVWFPAIWALGLERPAIEAPADLVPPLSSGAPARFRVIEGGLRVKKS